MERAIGKFSPRSQVIAGAIGVFLLLLLAWWQAGRWYERQLLSEQRSEAALEVALRGNVVSSILNRRFTRLQALAAFIQAHSADESLEQDFERFASTLYEDVHGVRNVALAPDGIVRYVYPLTGNEAVLGYQALEDPRPEVREDVQRTLNTGNIVLSGPIELIQGGTGLIARQAVYREGAFWGLTNVVLDLPILLREAGISDAQGNLVFGLRNRTGRVLYGDPLLFDDDPVVNTIDLPEGTWELAGVPREGWAATLQPDLSIFRSATLLVVLLLTSVAYLSINRQARLQEAVVRRTKEIAQVNALLEQRVRERTRELETLLDISYDISSTLELQPLLNLILKQLREVVDYTTAAVFLLDEDGGHLNRLHFLSATAEQGQVDAQPSGPRAVHDLKHHQEVIARRTPVLIPDVRADTDLARAYRQTATSDSDHEPNRTATWMGIPLMVRDRVIGLLTFEHQKPHHYESRDAKLALAFAGQAAIAIENARLYGQAQSLAVLQERHRMARELHDSVSQALYGIGLGSLTARRLLEQGEVDRVQEPLSYVHALAQAALAEMRALIFELRPESLEQEGLVAALEKQAAALQARNNLIVETDLGREPQVPLPIKEALYRVAQEAMHNVVKHAEADQVALRLISNGENLTLVIHDDGRGFDPHQEFPGHLGLRSMRERAEQIGGVLTVDSAPGRGAEIRARVPL